MIFLCNFLFLDKVANIALPTPARSDQDMLSHHLRSREPQSFHLITLSVNKVQNTFFLKNKKL